MITMNDYRILKSIISKDDKSKGFTMMKGTTIKEIVANTGLSDKKVRVTRDRFLKDGLICEGLKNGNEKSYILTIKGFEELNKIRKSII